MALLAAALLPGACSGSGTSAVRELMRTPIAPASDAIFNAVAYTNGRLVAAPQDDAAWAKLQAHGVSLAQAADALVGLAPEDGAAWFRESAALKDAALEVERGAQRKDVERILAAGGSVYATCTGCHAVYVKD